jgi:polyhydroxybutyrate depolymerase
MNRIRAFRTIPWVALVTAVACGGGSGTGTVAGSGLSAMGSNAGGSGGTSGGMSPSGARVGVGSDSGARSGSDSSGTFTSTGADSGVAASGVGSGVAGSGASGTDAGGGDASSGNVPIKGRTGMKSAGCGLAPLGAVSSTFTNHRISIPACAACTVPNCPSNCIAPPFVPGGVNAQTAGNGENFVNREFTIELPANYQPATPYPVFFGANGCGPVPPLQGAAFSVPGENGAIKVGLQQVGACFADGGIRCAPNIANVADCVNGPEIPYFLAVTRWIESNFCVDMGMEFIGGGSSGAWEALLAGCGAADTLRGIYTLAGGLREHRWRCNGPSAAFMIASDADTSNPVGPLPKLLVAEDSYGMAPARDEILARNGCVGKATAPYDPKFPFCVKYIGCPATYPVVWCEFPGGSHDNPTYNNVNYLNAVAPFLLGLPPAP